MKGAQAFRLRNPRNVDAEGEALGGMEAGETFVGDVLILVVLGIAGLTFAAFWLVRRWSREARRRFVVRATLALGGVLVLASGFSLADTGLTNALGLMVNYVYRPQRIEENHELYTKKYEIAATTTIESLARKA